LIKETEEHIWVFGAPAMPLDASHPHVAGRLVRTYSDARLSYWLQQNLALCVSARLVYGVICGRSVAWKARASLDMPAGTCRCAAEVWMSTCAPNVMQRARGSTRVFRCSHVCSGVMKEAPCACGCPRSFFKARCSRNFSGSPLDVFQMRMRG
jgi:hypothetical protein